MGGGRSIFGDGGVDGGSGKWLRDKGEDV